MFTKLKAWLSRISWGCVLLFLSVLFLYPFNKAVCGEEDKTYVGSDTCKECHETEYDNYHAFAKKSHSFNSIEIMKKGLTSEEVNGCYQCHTTGYGEKSGFKSESETPHLKNAGCEVCHGPGSVHVETNDPEDINGQLTSKACETCHNSERVGAFRYTPVIYGGAH